MKKKTITENKRKERLVISIKNELVVLFSL